MTRNEAENTRNHVRYLTIMFSFLLVLSGGYSVWQQTTSPETTATPVMACMAAGALCSVWMYALFVRNGARDRAASALVVTGSFVAASALLIVTCSIAFQG